MGARRSRQMDLGQSARAARAAVFMERTKCTVDRAFLAVSTFFLWFAGEVWAFGSGIFQHFHGDNCFSFAVENHSAPKHDPLLVANYIRACDLGVRAAISAATGIVFRAVFSTHARVSRRMEQRTLRRLAAP